MSGDDRLSAYLDDELSSDERSQLEAELAAQPHLRDELAVVGRSRDQVRGLPPVEPPVGFELTPATHEPVGADVVALDSRRRARPWVLGVAAATIFFLVLGFASGTPVAEVVPPVDSFVDQHAAATEAMPDDVVDGSFALLPMDEVDGMGPAMPDMPMVAAYRWGDITHFFYDTAHGPVSVFRQDGNLDATGLPGSEPMPMPTGTALAVRDSTADVVVVERDDVVFTVVGAPDNHDMVMGAASSVPDTDRSVIDQVRRWFGRWT